VLTNTRVWCYYLQIFIFGCADGSYLLMPFPIFALEPIWTRKRARPPVFLVFVTSWAMKADLQEVTLKGKFHNMCFYVYHRSVVWETTSTYMGNKYTCTSLVCTTITKTCNLSSFLFFLATTHEQLSGKTPEFNCYKTNYSNSQV
jgi:hypothetical protein